MRATDTAGVFVDEEADPIAELAGQPGRRPERAERLRLRPVRLGYRRLYQATKRVRSRAFWSRFTAIVDSSVAHRKGDRGIRKRRLAAQTPPFAPGSADHGVCPSPSGPRPARFLHPTAIR